MHIFFLSITFGRGEGGGRASYLPIMGPVGCTSTRMSNEEFYCVLNVGPFDPN